MSLRVAATLVFVGTCTEPPSERSGHRWRAGSGRPFVPTPNLSRAHAHPRAGRCPAERKAPGPRTHVQRPCASYAASARYADARTRLRLVACPRHFTWRIRRCEALPAESRADEQRSRSSGGGGADGRGARRTPTTPSSKGAFGRASQCSRDRTVARADAGERSLGARPAGSPDPQTRRAPLRSLRGASARVLASVVLARVRRERERPRARLRRPGVRARHGLGAGRSGRAARARRRPGRAAGRQSDPVASGVRSARRARRDDAAARPAGARAARRGQRRSRSWSRWRRRSTTCSTGWSPSAARARDRRCWCRRPSAGGSRASCTTKSARP